jgi:hypothetical protein
VDAKAMPLGDILTVTTRCLVNRDGIDGLYKFLDYMTNDYLLTHQLPRASDECRPHLFAQHRWLADINIPNWTHPTLHPTVLKWLEEIEAIHGRTVIVEPLAPSDHTVIHPMAELKMMRSTTSFTAVGYRKWGP